MKTYVSFMVYCSWVDYLTVAQSRPPPRTTRPCICDRISQGRQKQFTVYLCFGPSRAIEPPLRLVFGLPRPQPITLSIWFWANRNRKPSMFAGCLASQADTMFLFPLGIDDSKPQAKLYHPKPRNPPFNLLLRAQRRWR